MLTDKVKREIDTRLASVVNENETFTKYLLAEDDEYIEEKLNPEYKLWNAVVDAQYKIECNFGKLVATNNTIMYYRAAKREGRIKDAEADVRLAELEAKKRELKWDMDDLYAEAVRYLKEYDWYYSPDGERSANDWDWDFLKDKSFSDAPLWQFDA